MKASPYLIFNGNCAEAIVLYEKAFRTKANCCLYRDAPPSEEFPVKPELENLIMHGIMPIGESTIYLCDTTPDMPASFGDGAFACVELDTIENVKSAFEVLKDGGEVICPAQETFWNKCYSEVKDKFGLKWVVMVYEECTCTEECASGYNPNCTCTATACNCRKEK